MMVALSLMATACSNSSNTDGGSGASSTTARRAPEDRRASAAEVTDGLKQIEATAAEVAATAGGDSAGAKQVAGRIEPVWETIEGAVKANDPDAYIAFEDAFAVLEDAADHGDAAKARRGADAVSKTVATYLAKYPG